MNYNYIEILCLLLHFGKTIKTQLILTLQRCKMQKYGAAKGTQKKKKSSAPDTNCTHQIPAVRTRY